MAFINNNKNTKSSAAALLPSLWQVHGKEISERLKSADKFIMEGNLEKAKTELESVKAIDPRNVYAHALEERRSTMERLKDNQQLVGTTKTADEVAAKAEQSIAEILRIVREWHDAEIAALVTILQQKREKLQADLEKQL